MKAPQIIYLILVGIELLMHAHKHGQQKGRYNFWNYIINAIIVLLLLWWGGFF